MVSHARGEGGYRGADSGEVSSTLTGLYPWGRYAMTDRVTVWGTAGYGASIASAGGSGSPGARATSRSTSGSRRCGARRPMTTVARSTAWGWRWLASCSATAAIARGPAKSTLPTRPRSRQPRGLEPPSRRRFVAPGSAARRDWTEGRHGRRWYGAILTFSRPPGHISFGTTFHIMSVTWSRNPGRSAGTPAGGIEDWRCGRRMCDGAMSALAKVPYAQLTVL